MKKLKKRKNLNLKERFPSKSTRKKGVTLNFYEDTHQYIDDQNNKYLSVTSLIKKFSTFDEFEKAKELSERTCEDINLILKHWRTIRDAATTHGGNTHLACEEYIKNKNIVSFDDKKTNNCIKQALNFIDSIKYKIIACEKMLFSYELKISGQSDLIGREDNTLIIGDWKTNKSINETSSFDSFMKYPFDEFYDTEYWHYVIQLNIYLYIIKKENYYPWAKDYRLEIYHIKENKVEKYILPILHDSIVESAISLI